MRPYVVLTVLILMCAAWVAHFVLRPLPRIEEDQARNPEQILSLGLTDEGDAGLPDAPEPEVDQPSTDAAVPESPQSSEAGTQESSSETDGDTSPGDAPSEESEPRTFRIAGLGWDILAPGIWANKGAEPNDASRFKKAGIDISFSSVPNRIAAERALAEGGEDDRGADVIVMPLPEFVVSFEDLEPLDPQIIFVSGWSSGDHALFTREGQDFTPPRTVLVPTPVPVITEPATAEHFLALFMFDLAGIEAERITVISEDSEEAQNAELRAQVLPARRTEEPWQPFVTTEHASRLIPYVAVSTRAFVDEHREQLRESILIWLESCEQIPQKIPEVARLLGEIEGAPEALDLLGPLSRQRMSDVEENARLAGFSGIEAITVDALFDTTCDLWQRVEILRDSCPEPPVASELFGSFIRHGISRNGTGQYGVGEGNEALLNILGAQEFQPLFVIRTAALGENGEERALKIAQIAGIFEYLAFRTGRGPDAAILTQAFADAHEMLIIDSETPDETSNAIIGGLEVLTHVSR